MTHNSNTFDFHTVIDRRNTASLKWDKYKGRDILPLWVADMDFKSPPVSPEGPSGPGGTWHFRLCRDAASA